EKGMVVASTVENVLPQSNISSADTQMRLNSAIEQPDQFIEGVIDGNQRILMAKKVDIGSQKEWYMISSIDPELALNQLNGVMSSARILIVACVLGSVILMILLLNRFYRPIVSLRKIVHDLS
ncbi:methyl-accepting chemotaxis protein, partial [Vibrio sp. 10N.222.48.A8]